jgi:hypothetical protein
VEVPPVDVEQRYIFAKLHVCDVAFAVSLFAVSGAQAETCTGASFVQAGSSPASVASMIASTIATANTAFLPQSTAFIGSPANPEPTRRVAEPGSEASAAKYR